MKKTLILLAALLLAVINVNAKKVKVTIDGIAPHYMQSRYLIINEDTAHAQLINIKDGKFSVTVEVDKNAFIRIHDYKGFPQNCVFVLIPDSPHITVNLSTGEITGSPMSKRLKSAIHEAQKSSPEGFHIDVFSDNPEAWAEAQEKGRTIRDQMRNEQREDIIRIIEENKKNYIPAWIAYCFSDVFYGGMDEITRGKKAKWLKHPILNKNQ